LARVFGYNPVIEADFQDPAPQLKSILADIAQYQDSVDRNYRRLLEVGTWNTRVETLLSELGQRNYLRGVSHS
jgi:hypothetical protein